MADNWAVLIVFINRDHCHASFQPECNFPEMNAEYRMRGCKSVGNWILGGLTCTQILFLSQCNTHTYLRVALLICIWMMSCKCNRFSFSDLRWLHCKLHYVFRLLHFAGNDNSAISHVFLPSGVIGALTGVDCTLKNTWTTSMSNMLSSWCRADFSNATEKSPKTKRSGSNWKENIFTFCQPTESIPIHTTPYGVFTITRTCRAPLNLFIIFLISTGFGILLAESHVLLPRVLSGEYSWAQPWQSGGPGGHRSISPSASSTLQSHVCSHYVSIPAGTAGDTRARAAGWSRATVGRVGM